MDGGTATSRCQRGTKGPLQDIGVRDCDGEHHPGVHDSGGYPYVGNAGVHSVRDRRAYGRAGAARHPEVGWWQGERLHFSLGDEISRSSICSDLACVSGVTVLSQSRIGRTAIRHAVRADASNCRDDLQKVPLSVIGGI